MPYRILIAEDDASVASLITITMQTANHETFHAADGRQAKAAIETKAFDLALIDIMLPHVDGYELLELLKRKGIPAIFITAKTELADKVLGLRLGAEDYITKPFEPLELLARVDTALRRLKQSTPIIAYRDIAIDVGDRTAKKNGSTLMLTKIEYDLLALFFQNPRLVFSRDQLLDRVWGFDYTGGTRTVDMHIQRLRSKLGCPDIIETVRGIGYRLGVGSHAE